MSDVVIGICSKCEGDVVMPTAWLGTQEPRPRCKACGAVKKKRFPIVDME